MSESEQSKIKIVADGPYVVTGGVPLSEKIITPRGHTYVFEPGRDLPQAEEYSLCRCGKSKNKPFCDGAHENVGFTGTEQASREAFVERAKLLEGPGVDLLDDGRCAFARFCHRERGMVWALVQASDDAECRREAVEGAAECPAGRLVAVDAEGNELEPALEPSISILQDPEKHVSAGIYVQGGIPIESADGTLYEVRNRVTLCRCGASRNMPFCDASHVKIGFSDT